MNYFRDISTKDLQGKTVFLDIDGTITGDKSSVVDSPEESKLKELAGVANVVLVSNGHQERTELLGRAYQVKTQNVFAKKPSKKSVEGHVVDNAVVIGDKYITDGLLALRIGCPFIHVKTILHKKEGVFEKTFYALDDVIGMLFEMLRIMRPFQWIKNGLIFAPLFFAGALFNIPLLVKTVIAFFVFCLSSSAVYVINDLKDIELDRLHPRKKFRPLPFGSLTIFQAQTLLVVLLACVLWGLYTLPAVALVVVGYILFNTWYTLRLKHIAVVDIVSVALMYVIRLLVGGSATTLVVSEWIIVCVFFSTMFLISAKRYAEFKNPVRPVLADYSKQSLSAILISSASISIIGYVLYTVLGTHFKYMMYSGVFVVGVFWLLLNDVFKEHERAESPEVFLFTDKVVRLLFIMWGVYMCFVVYV